jgi:hypothetical protein
LKQNYQPWQVLGASFGLLAKLVEQAQAPVAAVRVQVMVLPTTSVPPFMVQVIEAAPVMATLDA